MKTPLTALLALGCAMTAGAEIRTESVEYRQGDTVLQGHLTYDTAITGKRPGVLIVHQWKGLSDYEKKRAEMLAQLGYVALAVDVYGKDIRPKSSQEAGAEAGKYKKDRQLLRSRVQAGLAVLQKSQAHSRR